jgi:nitroreductase
MADAMKVSDALKTRISTRAFLDKPVTEEQVRDILETARWSPSGGNLQPWRVWVAMDGARDRLIETVREAISKEPMGDESEINIYPPNLQEPWRTRRYALGEEMYELLGIPREDKPARIARMMQNFELFDAPVGLFFSLDRRFDKGQWAHLGMFMLSIALVATEKGLATCMQEMWTTRSKTVSKFFGLPESEQLYCGMALGYADPAANVNDLRSSRASVDEFATILTK